MGAMPVTREFIAKKALASGLTDCSDASLLGSPSGALVR
jgi:hypothetical protein